MVIHPLMYKSLQSLIGADNLESIIEPELELDGDGKPMSLYDKRIFKKKNARRYKKRTKVDETYAGLGMLGFYEHFDEIIDYFFKKKPGKKDVYDDIRENRSIIFTHSIPVYTTQLRIAKVENKRFTFESTNADFNLLAKLADQINKDHLFIYRNNKPNAFLPSNILNHDVTFSNFISTINKWSTRRVNRHNFFLIFSVICYLNWIVILRN